MGRIRNQRRTAALVGAAAVLLAGCSSSAHITASGGTRTAAGASIPASAPAVPGSPDQAASLSVAPTAMSPASADSIAGRWTGTFTSTKYKSTSGDFVVVFTQSGSHIGGTITVRPSCVPNATVSGSRSGGVVTFGQVSGSGNTVAFTGAVSGNTMHGTYHSSAGCGNDAGTWQASRG